MANTRRGNRQIVRDHGGDRNKGSGVLVSKKDTLSTRCESCGHLQFTTKGQLNRRAMPHCDKCGGYIDFTPASKRKLGVLSKKVQKKRECEECGATLSSSNTGTLCRPCAGPSW